MPALRTTERLLLRELNESYLELITGMTSDPSVNKYFYGFQRIRNNAELSSYTSDYFFTPFSKTHAGGDRYSRTRYVHFECGYRNVHLASLRKLRLEELQLGEGNIELKFRLRTRQLAALPIVARIRRYGHVRGTSGMVPAPDIPSEITASPLGPDVADTHRVRGFMTRCRHPQGAILGAGI